MLPYASGNVRVGRKPCVTADHCPDIDRAVDPELDTISNNGTEFFPSRIFSTDPDIGMIMPQICNFSTGTKITF
jgi:hypothetical protein